MFKEVADDVWLSFDIRLLKRISTQKTNVFLQVFRLIVFVSCNAVSPDIIYTNNFSEN